MADEVIINSRLPDADGRLKIGSDGKIYIDRDDGEGFVELVVNSTSLEWE